MRGLRNAGGALAAMVCIVLALAATAGARPADNFGPRPAAEAPAAVQEPAAAPDNGSDAIVFVLIGLGAGLAVLGAGYLGARRATRVTQAPPADVRIG